MVPDILTLPPLAGAGSEPKQPTVERQEIQQQEQEEPRQPEEERDNLFSTSYARVVHVLSEGEIAGLCDRAGDILNTSEEFGKAIFLDDTPLQNDNGGFNFRGVKVGMAWGTQDQEAIAGFGSAAETIYSGQDLKQGNPVVIGIDNPEADRIEVAVRFNAMLTQDRKTGDIKGSTVTYAIRIRHNGAPAVLAQEVTVTGKTRNPYIKSTSHKLPRDPDGPNTWEVIIQRISDEPINSYKQNTTGVETITVHTRNKYRYPNSAIVAAEISARGFSGIPTIGFRAKGILVKVPSNYLPEDRTYNRDPLTGEGVTDGEGNPLEQVWDGTFYMAWTNNPVWHYYDLLTNTRYGLGEEMGVTVDRPEGNVDKWSLYPISKYCDEMVDDGFGGIEPRFAGSVYIQSQEDAFKVASDFASVFRASLYWLNGALCATQDAPKPPRRVFTNANVIDGVFTYTGTGKKARHTVAVVRYNDEENSFRPAYEYVPDPVGIAKYGIRKTEIAAFACCSRGQAHRAGRHILTTELNETQVISFSTGLEGATLRPGDIFGVVDNHRAGSVQGGRLAAIAADRLSVRLDRPVNIPAGVVTVTLSRPMAFIEAAQIPDSSYIGSINPTEVVERTVTNAVGVATSLTFAIALPEEVELGAVWLIKTTAVEPALFRTMGISEKSGIFTITGLQYIAAKYGAIEQGLELEIPDVSDLLENPAEIYPPSDMVLTRLPVTTASGLVLKIGVSWTASPSQMVEHYLVEKRLDSGNWEPIETTKATDSEFIYTVPGTYDVRVTTVSALGARSEGLIASITVADENPIELFKVTGLELQNQGIDTNFSGRHARFSWRINSPATGGLDEEETGGADPSLRDYLIEILDASSGQIVHTETVLGNEWTFTYEKNALATGGPRSQFRIRVRGRDRYLNLTDPAELVVQNPAPGAVGSLSVQSGFQTAALEWTLPGDLDLEAVEIYESASSNFGSAAKVGETAAGATTFTRSGLTTGQTRYYWVRTRDTFGTLGPQYPAGNGLSTTPGTVNAADIASYAIDATKVNLKIVVLVADVWSNNTTTGGVTQAGSIAWNAHQLIYGGVAYSIPAGATTLPFVYWDPVSPNVYTATNTNPLSLPNGSRFFQIATNTAGVHDLAWNGLANAVIGSAHIQNLAVTDAKIQSMNVSKLIAGTILSQLIVLAGVGGAIKSDNYVANSAGWIINADGSAEFGNAKIRGNLSATRIYNTNSLVNPAYPNHPLLSSLHALVGAPTHDFAYGAGGSPTVYIKPPGLATVTRTMIMPAWSLVRFYGLGVLPSAEQIANGKPVNADRRIANADEFGRYSTFYFTVQGTITGAQPVAVLYRIVPATQYRPTAGADLSINGNATYPWLQAPDDASGGGGIIGVPVGVHITRLLPFQGTISLYIPADSVVEFIIAPLNNTGVGSSTNDVITNPSFRVDVDNAFFSPTIVGPTL